MTSENEHESMTESEADRDRDRDRDQENRIPTDKPVDAGSHNHDHDQERGDSDSGSDSGSDGDSGETVKSKVRGDVDRASGGEFMPKYNDDDVLELLASNAPEPLSAPEVADEVGCSRGTARNKLDSFVDDGIVATKKLGARSRGYWLTDTGVDSLGVAVY